MTATVWLVVVGALALTSALGGMALYAVRVAAFPGTLPVTVSERVQLYAGAVLMFALMGQIWLEAAHRG